MINKKLLNPIQNKGATKTGTSAEAHDTLTNRDKAEQHPISAISGLQGTLDNFVTLDTAQTITGEKTFSKKLTINQNLNFEIAGSNASFIDWYKDGVRLAYLGKGSSSKDDISFDVVNDLNFNAANIRFSGKELKKITTPTADDSATTKKYVDDNLLLKADKTAIDTINVELGVHSTNISQNAANILLKADKTELDLKQNKLTAGAGIDITGDTISSTGGATGNFVTLDTDQKITGEKTFSKSIQIEYNDKKFYIETTASGILRLTSPSEIHFENNAGILFVLNNNGISCFNKRLTAIGDPTNEKDATTKKYVDDGLTLKANQTDVVDLSTTQAVRGNKTFMNACYVNNAPTNGKGIANKEYVDGKTLTNVDTLIKSATTTIPSLTTAGDSTQTITSIFDAATWDLIKASNQYYLLAYTSSRASRTGFPIVIKMEYAMTSNDYNVHTGAGDFTFFNYTDFATTYAIKVMVALSRANGSFRFVASFNGTLNANFNINRIEIWKKGTV